MIHGTRGLRHFRGPRTLVCLISMIPRTILRTLPYSALASSLRKFVVGLEHNVLVVVGLSGLVEEHNVLVVVRLEEEE